MCLSTNRLCDESVNVMVMSELGRLSLMFLVAMVFCFLFSRSQKYCLRMCSRAFQLLIQFLQVWIGERWSVGGVGERECRRGEGEGV